MRNKNYSLKIILKTVVTLNKAMVMPIKKKAKITVTYKKWPIL
ncbi:MAG: hypothetical protein ACJA0C_000580 [Candidatus Endobugula sp.]|jgi:hypothetical protein